MPQIIHLFELELHYHGNDIVDLMSYTLSHLAYFCENFCDFGVPSQFNILWMQCMLQPDGVWVSWLAVNTQACCEVYCHISVAVIFDMYNIVPMIIIDFQIVLNPVSVTHRHLYMHFITGLSIFVTAILMMSGFNITS